MSQGHEKPNQQRTFTGKNLLQIAMPLGGIGTGCISLNGYGGLQDFSIHHSPVLSAMPDRNQPLDAAYALLHFPSEGQTRLLEGQFPPEKIFNSGLKSQGYVGGGFEGFPRYRECAFKGEYPSGYITLDDPDLPFTVKIHGFNPFIPLDDINSGIPCAILEYTLINKTKHIVPYQFSYHLSHLAQRGAEKLTRSESIPGYGVYFWNEAPTESPAFGSAAIGILNGDPLIKARWFRGGWFDAGSAIWQEVSQGRFNQSEGLGKTGVAARDGGSICVSGELHSEESITYPVVITWYFPNATDPVVPSGNTEFDAQSCWHPFYSTQWKDARDVLFYIRDNFDLLQSQSKTFHDALFSSTVPSFILDAVSANLGILKSPTVLRKETGDIWAWEGCYCDRGCCPGSCTHVWNYAQSLPHLFPKLERTLREQEFMDSMNETGHINFRLPFSSCCSTHDFHAAVDGQLGGILKMYREWQIFGNLPWLQSMYPFVKRSLDFCIEMWDPRHTGLIEEPHHNTYDVEFWGPDGLSCSFYLTALTAMGRMAMEAGYPSDICLYEELAMRGKTAIQDRLFNGEYYQQAIMFEQIKDKSFVEKLIALESDNSEEARLLRSEGPKYQVGSGCLSDGVFGAWLGHLCGIDSPQDHQSIRDHLASVYKYNFRTNLSQHANPQRPGYALGDEAGLLLCSWPKGGKPTLPFVYSDESWTGIEYQVASHLIAIGMIEEGFTIVKAVRTRYDGRVRNPWNEYECGSYYARAMASYALLSALSGFRYSAVDHEFIIAPTIPTRPFRCFFSTASGWGTFTLRDSNLEINLSSGELEVETLNVTINDQQFILHPRVKITANDPFNIQLSNEPI